MYGVAPTNTPDCSFLAIIQSLDVKLSPAILAASKR
jgi:hypothetical protein